jgi:GH15 family glucan-1,4-alpha-glucosidase
MMTDAGRIPLGARAWIGDGVTGALVTADGTVDWYCPGRFDGPGALYRILDPTGGAVRVGPVREGTGVTRRLPPGGQVYRPGTMVVDTDTRTQRGRVLVTDFMPWGGAAVGAPGRIVRIATALAGPVDVEVEVVPGWRWAPAVKVSSWSEGLVADGLAVRCGFPLLPDPLGRDLPRWRGVQRLDVGESIVVTIDDVHNTSHRALSVDAALRLAEDTAVAWRSWAANLVYGGGYGPAVERAALVTRALTATATGGPVVAGTASLPRVPGGERNDDARLARWRDAAAATRAFAALGLNEDAEAAERWLREAVERHTPTQGPVAAWPATLAPDGGPAAETDELPLAGWRRSQPVVEGADPELLDLDAYGDVLTAVSVSQLGPGGTGRDGPLAGADGPLRLAADWLTDNWRRPDGGVWAARGPASRLVASAVQSCLALEATVRRAQAVNPLDLAVVAWRDESKAILHFLETEGLAPDGGLRRDLSADHADAALLRVAWRGPWPRRHPIVQRTVDRTIERLASGLLVHRVSGDVDDGQAGTDSPDLLASLWAARALAALDRWEEAHERLEALIGLGGELGLLAEAAAPVSSELYGNLPATGVHLAVIETALALDAGPR